MLPGNQFEPASNKSCARVPTTFTGPLFTLPESEDEALNLKEKKNVLLPIQIDSTGPS